MTEKRTLDLTKKLKISPGEVLALPFVFSSDVRNTVRTNFPNHCKMLSTVV